jgi:hypothetical protein
MGKIIVRDATGAEVALAAGQVAAVESNSESLVSNVVDGVLARLNGEPMSTTEMYASDIALHAANTIATSMYTRKRVYEGKEPIAKLLF